jgi:hypothetical protein
MDWSKIFGKSDHLSPSEKTALEDLDKNCIELRAWHKRISDTWPKNSEDRLGKIRSLSELFAKHPSEKLHDEILKIQNFSAWPNGSWQGREALLDAINLEINRKMEPQYDICKRVLRRALSQAEDELKKVEKRDKAEAQEAGFEYSASGKVLALQKRILGLRNEIEAPTPFEAGCIVGPLHWRERLKEFIQ